MNDMRFKASWGLSALEGIVRGNVDDLRDSYIPSYVYYGVKDPKSLAMHIASDPLNCVAIGTGIALRSLDMLHNGEIFTYANIASNMAKR